MIPGRTLLEAKAGLAPIPSLNYKLRQLEFDGRPGRFLFPYCCRSGAQRLGYRITRIDLLRAWQEEHRERPNPPRAVWLEMVRVVLELHRGVVVAEAE